MKASKNLNEEARKLAYGEYVKERVKKKGSYYGLNFEEFLLRQPEVYRKEYIEYINRSRTK